ncbi:MAG: DNA-directed RNA polymerase subunit alpha [Gemmatimonadales bacterium]|nr:DNA-directed RNA polymerase subunit alpha [Gemmatimonadales bacterium]
MTKREDTPFAAEFRLQPLERGYGHTLGNALRRMLLSSLPGTAVWAFRLEGVVHEHQTLPSVVEDIHQIIQRLKSMTLVMQGDHTEAVLQLKASKAGPVTAANIQPHPAVQIIGPEHLLFTLQEDREISGELYVRKGRGYVEASQHDMDRSLPVDLVRIDALYNPVRRANFTVQETRVGQRTDFDSLTLTVETNGAVAPEDSVAYAAALVQEHFRYFVEFGKTPIITIGESDGGAVQTVTPLRELLTKPIDDCGLSVRSINSLKNSSISTLGDLVTFAEDDLLKVKNVGEKALGEIAEMLRREGLNFGMEFEERNGDVVVTNEGTTPVAVGGDVGDLSSGEPVEG